MIDKLERKMTAKNVLKDMEPFRYPGSAPMATMLQSPMNTTIRWWKLSWKIFAPINLGKIVGVPSWGGLVEF